MSSKRKEEMIIIRESVYKKFMHFVDKAPGEVSGLGSVELIDGVPVVTDVWIVKQSNSGAASEMDATEVAKLLFEHKDKDLRWWVHSHADMGVFWSGTDQDTFKELGGNGWICGTVVNKKRDILSGIFTTGEKRTSIGGFVPEQFTIFSEKVKTVILDNTPKEVIEAWDKEYETACARPSFPYLSYGETKWSDVWAERRRQSFYPMFVSDRCCSNWESFMEKHKEEVEKFQKEEPVSNFGEMVAQGLLEEARSRELTEQTDEHQLGTYEEVTKDVKDLFEDGLPYSEVEDLIETMYGKTWTWVVRPTHERLQYQKSGGIHAI